MTSITRGTQDEPYNLTSGTGESKKSSNVKPDKVHMESLVEISIFWKDPIHQRETPETNGSKNFIQDNIIILLGFHMMKKISKITNLMYELSIFFSSCEIPVK